MKQSNRDGADSNYSDFGTRRYQRSVPVFVSDDGEDSDLTIAFICYSYDFGEVLYEREASEEIIVISDSGDSYNSSIRSAEVFESADSPLVAWLDWSDWSD